MNMKLILPLLILGSLCAPLCPAQSKENSPTQDSAQNMKAQLSKMSFFNAQPNTKAQYYIILRSASWCAPCRRELPDIVTIYPEIKKSQAVELILWSADKDEVSGKKFLTDHKASFPGTMKMDSLEQHMRKHSGIPHAYVLDKDGNILYHGDPKLILEWKKYTLDFHKNKAQLQEEMKKAMDKKKRGTGG